MYRPLPGDVVADFWVSVSLAPAPDYTMWCDAAIARHGQANTLRMMRRYDVKGVPPARRFTFGAGRRHQLFINGGR